MNEQERLAYEKLLTAATDAAAALHAIAAAANDMPRRYAAMIHAAMPFGYGNLDAAIDDVKEAQPCPQS